MTKFRPDTRTAILQAGFDLFSRRSGASLADVADLAGVGRATLHRHFASRDDLLAALARQAMDELDAAIDDATKDAPSYSEALRLALQAIVPLATRHRFLETEPLGHIDDLAARFAEARRETVDLIHSTKAEGLFAPDVPADWVAECFDALIYAAWTQVADQKLTPTQAADLAWRTLTSGLQGATP